MARVLRFLESLGNVIDLTLNKVSSNLDFENTLSGRNINEILQNEEDRRKVDAAIEFLKQHREQKTEEITLSDKEKLTISIS